MNDTWHTVEPALVPLLAADDDPDLWRAVLDAVLRDARVVCRLAPPGWTVVAGVGRCSHWLRPHQTRWTADGGFAWPTGYGGPRWSRLGLPEFDWSREWTWDAVAERWRLMTLSPAANLLAFRVAVPSRSRRHLQAAIHTVWRPGRPLGCDADVIQFYGFRRRASGWACTAYRATPSRAEGLYERAVSGLIPPEEG
jgi:hypothetical protein